MSLSQQMFSKAIPPISDHLGNPTPLWALPCPTPSQETLFCRTRTKIRSGQIDGQDTISKIALSTFQN